MIHISAELAPAHHKQIQGSCNCVIVTLEGAMEDILIT